MALRNAFFLELRHGHTDRVVFESISYRQCLNIGFLSDASWSLSRDIEMQITFPTDYFYMCSMSLLFPPIGDSATSALSCRYIANPFQGLERAPYASEVGNGFTEKMFAGEEVIQSIVAC